MKKQIVLILVVASFISSGRLRARELRTPLPLYHGYAHFPLTHTNEEDGKETWYGQVWSGAWFRTADKAYSECHGRKRTPLSRLFFGASDFRGEEAFFGGEASVPTNPWLNISTMKPRVRYSEHGVTFGVTVNRQYKKAWNLGFRANLPYRIIDVDRYTDCCDQFSSELGGERLEDVVDYKPESFTNGDPAVTTGLVNYAYRLDFLSQLPFAVVGPAVNEPLVNYANDDFGDRITIANQDITGAEATANVHAIKRADGTKPPLNVPYGSSGNANGTINADGSGIAENQRGAFSSETDYTPLGTSRAAQKMLWIVPKIEFDGDVAAQTLEAKQINGAVKSLLAVLDDSAEDFFTRQHICFQSQRNQGFGDLDTEFYANYTFSSPWWVEGMFGLRLPTGGRIKDPRRVFVMPRGNGGHVEVKLAVAADWEPEQVEWLKLKADVAYSHVFSRTERIAAPFKGATAKNIGPCVDAKISWGYFLGHLDLTFVEPDKKHCGVDIGYELYAKRKDTVKFECQKATDFQGVNRELNACIVEKFTNVVAHKFRTELFWECCNCNLFGGWTHVFAGKNAPRETDWYFGLQVKF